MPKLKTASLAICLTLLSACIQDPEPTQELTLDTVMDTMDSYQTNHMYELLSTLSLEERAALGDYMDRSFDDLNYPGEPNFYDVPVTYRQAVEMLDKTSVSELQTID